MNDITLQPKPHAILSARELETFIMLGGGVRCADIADGLQLSMKTISTYRRRALTKMKLRDNHAITVYCIKNGLVTI